MSHADLMTRLENSSANESSHELACRCQDARKALAAADVRVAELEAAAAKLISAILSAHPSGQDEEADPFKVLACLGREWLDEVMRRPPQTVTFVDDDGIEGTLEWEEGDDSVGIRGGYLLADAALAQDTDT